MPDQSDNWGYRLQQLEKDDVQRRGQFYSNSTSLAGLDWGRTDWSYSTIDEIKAAADVQNSATHAQAAASWGLIVNMLEGLGASLRAAGTDMEEGWDPSVTKAAASFFNHVGASTWSMDDWATYARGNQTALEAMAEEVSTTKQRINTIYKNYLRDIQSKRTEIQRVSALLDGGPASANGSGGGDPADSQDQVNALEGQLRNIVDSYTKQAAVAMNELGDSYIANAHQLNEGHKYQGPTTSKTVPNSSANNSGSSNNNGSGGNGNGGGSSRNNGGNNGGTNTRRTLSKTPNDTKTRNSDPTDRPRPSTDDGTDTSKGDPKDTGGTGGTGGTGDTGSTGDSGNTGGNGGSDGTGGTDGTTTPGTVVGRPGATGDGTGTGTGTGTDTGTGTGTGTGNSTGTGTGSGTPQTSHPTVIRGNPASPGTPTGPGSTPSSSNPTTRFGTPTTFDPDGAAGRPSAFPSNPASGVPGSPIGRGGGTSSGFPGGPGGRSGLPGGAGMRNSLLGRLGGGGGGGTSSFPSGGGGTRGINSMRGGIGSGGSPGGGASGVPGAGGGAGRGMSGSGGGPNGRGMPGGPGQNGKGNNGFGAGRKDGRRLEDDEDAKKGPSYREDSAEYLGDMPEMPQQLLGPARPRVEPGRRTGFSLGRLSKKRRVEEELEGRRSRPQHDEELLIVPMESKPDLTGRRAFGGLEIEKAAAVGLPELLKGGHAAPEVVAPEGARRAVRRGENVSPESEQWQVDVPDRIVAAQEEAAQHRGRALAAENRNPGAPSA
ncbi:hypothetical protein [Kineosporia sp. NBRC 101731]|uniref:hypothetical protein n=1 Tax=Kineosporia sp. NBRC 101731 TaxID=3032199 RepID=UPI0024A3A7EA|nr:hypothetical protein [Kineosporia sp. NBRC 101731]GLY28112.1 hypothetical protein Kisp02_14770 [Kineosporia sp. NBRC 101731]